MVFYLVGKLPVFGGVACVGAGALTGTRLLSIGELLDPLKNMVDVMQSIPTMVAKSQVPFSSTSVVCLTPINWLLNPPMLPERPPPLGFWINTIKPRIIQAREIKIKNMTVILNSF